MQTYPLKSLCQRIELDYLFQKNSCFIIFESWAADPATRSMMWSYSLRACDNFKSKLQLAVKLFSCWQFHQTNTILKPLGMDLTTTQPYHISEIFQLHPKVSYRTASIKMNRFQNSAKKNGGDEKRTIDLMFRSSPRIKLYIQHQYFIYFYSKVSILCLVLDLNNKQIFRWGVVVLSWAVHCTCPRRTVIYGEQSKVSRPINIQSIKYMVLDRVTERKNAPADMPARSSSSNRRPQDSATAPTTTTTTTPGASTRRYIALRLLLYI
jgi:hypothetical protein